MSAELIPAGQPIHLRTTDPQPPSWGQDTPTRVDALVGEWLIGYESANTRAAYTVAIEHWLAYCAASRLDPLRIRRPHVDAWLRGQEAQLVAPATRHQRVSALSAFYRWCTAQDAVDFNPCEAVKRPKVDQAMGNRALTRAQRDLLLDAVDASTHPYAARERLSIRLMVEGGLRVGSLVGANLSGLGTVKGAYGLTYPIKGRRHQFVPFNQPIAVACEEYLEHRNTYEARHAIALRATTAATRPLFTLYGSPDRATRHSFTTALTRYAVEALGEQLGGRVTPHWLRHTFATHARAEGVDFADLQDALGHANANTTRLYDNDRNNPDRHPVRRLAR